MAPIRGRGGRPRVTSSRTFKPKARQGGRTEYQTSRVQDIEQSPIHDVQSDRNESENEHTSDDDASNASEDGFRQAVKPYNILLQSLQTSASRGEPQRKRRKRSSPENDKQALEYPPRSPEYLSAQEDVVGADESENENDEEKDLHIAADDMIDDKEDSSDPFETHFANPDSNYLSDRLKALSAGTWTSERCSFSALGTCTSSIPGSENEKSPSLRIVTSVKHLKLKRRLVDPSNTQMSTLSAVERALVQPVFQYRDVIFGARTVENAESLRRITCLHAVNHIFKTRDRVLKNNSRLSKAVDHDELELRDQGFTRPKVLMLLETRQACVRTVETMMQLCEPEQQENKKRFLDSYSQAEGKFSGERAEDFRELFDGNDDNEFRIGIKFTRKTVKFFSKFYNSDIIFASPLGLRRAIESAGPKKKDCDYLSSIEIVVMDQADAMLMQNWEHVEYVFEHLNLQPKDAHGCDFSRVRNWYLDGHSKHLRQTIVLSAYITPELNSLSTKHMQNFGGKVKYQPEYEGAILDIGLSIKQTFSRFDSPTPADDPDARFKYFTTAIVPSLTRHPRPADGGGPGILIFIPTYHDFVRVRNYFATSAATAHLSFGAVSEYAEPAEARRARSHFLTGRHAVLLYTARAHHFRRYQIRGVRRVVMYGLPDNPVFYKEVVAGFVGTSIGEGRVDAKEAGVRAMFSRWDGLKLERVVGTARVRSMLRERGGDTFDFV